MPYIGDRGALCRLLSTDILFYGLWIIGLLTTSVSTTNVNEYSLYSDVLTYYRTYIIVFFFFTIHTSHYQKSNLHLKLKKRECTVFWVMMAFA